METILGGLFALVFVLLMYAHKHIYALRRQVYFTEVRIAEYQFIIQNIIQSLPKEEQDKIIASSLNRLKRNLENANGNP